MSDFALEHVTHREIPRSKSDFRATLTAQMHVLHALILHDIKTRFFGSGIGYVITILWPTVHMAVVMIAFIFGGRQAPYGDSRLLYVATAVLPYICWNYITRFTMLGVTQNKFFLQYPIIRPLDIMFARIALEIISSFIITILLLTALLLLQVDIVPHHLDRAALGLISAVLLGIGFGIINGVICMIFPLWQVPYILIAIGCWFTAGVGLNPELLPPAIGDIIAYNPLLHSIEWIRSAYYDDFPTRLLSKSYVLSVAFGSFSIGLVMERILRRYMV